MNRNPSVLVKNKASLKDEYRTPHFITRELLNNVTFKGRIVDPCAGEWDDISKASNNIITGLSGDALNFNYENKNIVTNPPYSIIDSILEAFFKTCNKKIALFLPIEYISVITRQTYMKLLSDLLIFNLRMNLTYWRGGEKVDFGAVTYAWFVFNKEEKIKLNALLIDVLDRKTKREDRK